MNFGSGERPPSALSPKEHQVPCVPGRLADSGQEEGFVPETHSIHQGDSTKTGVHSQGGEVRRSLPSPRAWR